MGIDNGQTIRLYGELARSRAKRMIENVPSGFVVNISEPTRTNDQNALMWALLSDVSRAKPEGRKLTPKVWKTLFMHSLDHEIRFEQALDGKGMVPIDYSTSRLSKDRMSELIECILEYGARHAVQWSEPQRDTPTPALAG